MEKAKQPQRANEMLSLSFVANNVNRPMFNRIGFKPKFS